MSFIAREAFPLFLPGFGDLLSYSDHARTMQLVTDMGD